MHKRTLAILCLGALTAACADVTQPKPMADEAPALASVSEDELAANLSVVAKTLALGMQQESVRESVRDALQASEFSEHKIPLRKLLTGTLLATVVDPSARAAALAPADFRSMMSRLPDMDFYVPLREHRTSWEGNGNYVVAFSTKSDSPRITAFTPSGTQLTYNRADGIPEFAIILIHPAELRGIRVTKSLGLPRNRRVIQDSEESDIGIVAEQAPANGFLASLSPTAPRFAWGWDPSYSTAASYISGYHTHEDDGVGGCEMRYRARLRISGVDQAATTTNVTGIECPRYGNLGAVLHTGNPESEPGIKILDAKPTASNHVLKLEIWEDDQFSDDYMGYWWFYYSATYTWPNGYTPIFSIPSDSKFTSPDLTSDYPNGYYEDVFAVWQ